MVQIIGRTRPTVGEQFAAGVQKGGEQGMNFAQKFLEEMNSKKATAAENEALAQMGIDLSGITSPDARKAVIAAQLKGMHQKEKMDALENLFKNPQAKGQGEGSPTEGPVSQKPAQFSPSQLTDENILKAGIEDPAFGRLLQQQKDIGLREKRAEKEFEYKQEKGEREYHTQFSKPVEEKVAKLRESIPRKESALNFSREAIETGDPSYFSKDKLADATGIDLFRTAKGAQLITAGKENLLSNMARTSARAQNLWFEQRLNSMFAKIGQSEEANLTVQEMLEGEVAMDKVYQGAFDRLSDEDENKFGYVKKDIDKRVHSEIKDQEKQIFNRTCYRLRELEEKEKGIEKLRNQAGQNVIKGTPLTLAMAKIYKDKFGDKALAVAKKNGYYIPTLEEFQSYEQRPQEFRENLE